MQHNFDKYLSLVMSGQEIVVTQNGQAVGRFVPQTTTSYLTDSLLGILKDNSNWDTIRTENVDSKQMGNVQTAEVTDSKEDDYTEYYNDSAQKTPAVRKNVRGMNAPITNNATIIPTGFSSGIVGFSWPDVLQNAVIRCIALLFQEKHFR